MALLESDAAVTWLATVALQSSPFSQAYVRDERTHLRLLQKLHDSWGLSRRLPLASILVDGAGPENEVILRMRCDKRTEIAVRRDPDAATELDLGRM